MARPARVQITRTTLGSGCEGPAAPTNDASFVRAMHFFSSLSFFVSLSFFCSLVWPRRASRLRIHLLHSTKQQRGMSSSQQQQHRVIDNMYDRKDLEGDFRLRFFDASGSMDVVRAHRTVLRCSSPFFDSNLKGHKCFLYDIQVNTGYVFVGRLIVKYLYTGDERCFIGIKPQELMEVNRILCLLAIRPFKKCKVVRVKRRKHQSDIDIGVTTRSMARDNLPIALRKGTREVEVDL